MNKYETLVTALKALATPPRASNDPPIPFAEFAWASAPKTGDYGVIALDSQSGSVWSNNRMREQALQGTVDVFCRSSNGIDELRLVQSVLDSQGVSYALNSIQYESDRAIVHLEWVFDLEAV